MRAVAHRAARLAPRSVSGEIVRVQAAWGLVVAAEAGHLVALGVFAFERGGASAVGIAGLVRLVPAAVLAPVAATLVDRFRRERFLLAVTLLGVAALGGSAAAAWSGSEPATYALAALVGVSSTLFRPGFQALLPSLARSTQELIGANALGSSVEGLGVLVGPLVAGALAAGVSVPAAFLVWAAAAVVAAALLLTLRVQSAAPAAPPSLRHVLPDLSEGAVTAARARGTRVVLVLVLVQTFVRGCLNVLIVVLAYRLLDRGAGMVGVLSAAIGLGGVVGAVWAMRLRARRLAGLFSLALVVWGVPIALLAAHPDIALAIVLLSVVGAANSVEDVTGLTLFQRRLPDAMLGRILGLEWGLAMGAAAVGSAVAPAIVALAGPRGALVVVGLLLPVATLLAVRSVALLDADAPDNSLAVVDGVRLLAPLSLATKERLARALTPLDVAPGEVVVRQGDAGDRFYVLEAGEVEVDASGTRRTLTAPDAFGEIALLRDVPRTATVRALTPVCLLALGRADFLAAVTGHAGASSAAEAVMGERLAGVADPSVSEA